jgi:subtilisin family serine protease
MLRISLLVLLLVSAFTASAQQQKVWWIYFADKQGSTFDPYSFYDPAAVERRVKNNLSLYDYTDYPVSPDYLRQVRSVVDTLGYASRWMNAVSVVATDQQIAQVRTFSFVSDVVLQGGFEWVPCAMPARTTVDEPPVDGISWQVRAMQGEQFAKHNVTGLGINICILDAGFWGTDTHESFSSLRHNGQIKATRNFISNDSSVYTRKTDHGTSILSCIAGKDETQSLGMAPGANFLLGLIAKEYGNQYRAEEHYIAGVEWADQKGAHIINISGGPNENAYFPEDMDGKTPVISFACKVAARKGILVIAAAGNNGQRWTERQLLPPAETDSVLSVTAIGDSGWVADYSAVGPPPDFRRKPDVCAPGEVLMAAREKKGNVYAYGEGTSFSAPLVAGFAACLMQKYPEITAMGTIDSIRRSGHLYPYYDYAHGYGVPSAGYFYRENDAPKKSFYFTRSDSTVVFNVEPGADTLCERVEDHLLFWSMTDPNGRITNYRVEDVTQRRIELSSMYKAEYRGYKLCAWYKHYYAEIDF